MWTNASISRQLSTGYQNTLWSGSRASAECADTHDVLVSHSGTGMYLMLCYVLLPTFSVNILASVIVSLAASVSEDVFCDVNQLSKYWVQFSQHPEFWATLQQRSVARAETLWFWSYSCCLPNCMWQDRLGIYRPPNIKNTQTSRPRFVVEQRSCNHQLRVSTAMPWARGLHKHDCASMLMFRLE